MNLDIESIVRAAGLLGIAGLIFAESGLLIGLVLPGGESLLFTSGFLASQGLFNIYILIVVCVAATIAGDNTGYEIGKRAGKRLFKKKDSKFFKQSYLRMATSYYERYGRKTVIISRFIPIVRTFAPMVAGAAHMDRLTFFKFNFVGAVIFAGLIPLAGYQLGSKIPGVEEFFPFILIGVIVVSTIVPGIIHYLIAKRRKKALHPIDIEEIEKELQE